MCHYPCHIGTVLQQVKSIACVNETLDYHPDTGVTTEWLERNFNCPIELLGHGTLPHRVLGEHHHHHLRYLQKTTYMNLFVQKSSLVDSCKQIRANNSLYSPLFLVQSHHKQVQAAQNGNPS